MRLFNTDTTESIAAFFTGGVPAGFLSYTVFDAVLYPLLLAAGTGIIGGICALAGKDLYKWAKKKLFGADVKTG